MHCVGYVRLIPLIPERRIEEELKDVRRPSQIFSWQSKVLDIGNDESIKLEKVYLKKFLQHKPNLFNAVKDFNLSLGISLKKKKKINLKIGLNSFQL